MTECEGVITPNSYSVVCTAVNSKTGRVEFNFVFTGDAHRWTDFIKETAHNLAAKKNLHIKSWRVYPAQF